MKISGEEAAAAFQKVSEKFDQVGKDKSERRYIIIKGEKISAGEKTSGSWFWGKREAATFKEVTELVSHIMEDTQITSSEKLQVLAGYKKITKGYEDRNSSFFRRVFDFIFKSGARLTEAKQVMEQARSTLINDFKNQLKSKFEEKQINSLASHYESYLKGDINKTELFQNIDQDSAPLAAKEAAKETIHTFEGKKPTTPPIHPPTPQKVDPQPTVGDTPKPASPYQAKTDDFSKKVEVPLKTFLVEEMERTMGKHLTTNQKATLLTLFDQAFKMPNPQQALKDLIHEKINQPDGWGTEKAKHIQRNLLHHLPLNAEPLTVKDTPKPASPYQAKTDDFSKKVEVPLKTFLVEEMERTMGKHLTTNQKATLLTLFDQAFKMPNPQQALKNLIHEKINQPDGWGTEKAEHIQRNLLHHLPLNAEPLNDSFHSLQMQVQTIAQTPINPQGQKLVCFYKGGPTEFLGNFANCPHGIQIWGHSFKCSEAAFQWRKYCLAALDNHRQDMLDDPKMQEFFTCNGEEAFRLNQDLGRKYQNANSQPIFPFNWRKGARDIAMWDVLNAKFQQNPELAQLLKATQGAYLLEHNEAARDNYWSDNSNGSGKNMLGKMLMALRDGTPSPPPDDSSDQMQVQAYASYANSPGALNYQIF